MENKIQYSEKIISIGLIIILGTVTVAMGVFLFSQLALGPIGTRPAPTWILALLFFLFLLTTINFSILRITMNDQEIKVSYGIFKSKRHWNNLQSCEVDDKNYFYGWGIRLGRYKKGWIWVYNVIGGPRVVFKSKDKKPMNLMVSTKNPEEILRIARGNIGKFM